MPPMCEPCNRQFRNKEAAKQHLQSSGSNHPFCDHPRCDGRRFLSEQARDAHMADKHPPTFDCESCSRSFASPSALEDHYRGSPNHPNCAKCGMGFVDGKARDEHHHSAHPRVSCQLCGGVVIYKDALESHYLDTGKHPKCVTCNLGFKDAASYEEHQKSAHPKPECTSCEREFPDNETLQRHYYVSPSHPECPLCQIGFKDNVEYQEHLESHPPPSTASQQQSGITSSETTYGLLPLSPTPMNFTNLPQAGAYHGRMASSPVLTLQTNPLSPTMSIWTPDISPAVPLPPPGRDPKFEAAWGARANIPIQATPPCMRPNTASGPASSAVRQAALSPIWSQGSSGNNKIQESVYSSPGVRAISHTPSANFNPFNSRVDGDIGQKEATSPSPFPEWRSVRTSQRPPGITQISEAQAARQASTAIKYGLYQGNSAGSFTHRLAEASIPPRLTGPTPASSGPYCDAPASVAKAPLKSLATPGPRQLVVDWVELIGEKDCSVTRTHSSRSDDVSSTQAVATPISYQMTALAGPSSCGENSMSASSEKFPAGTFSPWNEPHLNVPLPTSASHSSTGSSPPSIKFTPFSPRTSQPPSPVVTSPIGLADLPTISPLASTPVEAFFGTATRDDTPSLTSTVPFSPFHLAIDTRLPESPSVASLASVSHGGSPRGSGAGSLNVDILSLPLPDSPSVSELASPAPNLGMTPLLTTSNIFDIERDVRGTHPTAGFMPIAETEGDADAAAPVTPHEEERDEYTAHSVTEASSTIVEEHAKSSLRVHCRMCQADPCVEPTATLCGHLFCYRCVSEHILQDPHCPVCSRAMMLNCLLTLHLSE